MGLALLLECLLWCLNFECLLCLLCLELERLLRVCLQLGLARQVLVQARLLLHLVQEQVQCWLGLERAQLAPVPEPLHSHISHFMPMPLSITCKHIMLSRPNSSG